jgi:Predicted transcriptional regulator
VLGTPFLGQFGVAMSFIWIHYIVKSLTSQELDYILKESLTVMPVRNILKSICIERLNIPNANQLKIRTGLGQGTCLRIWNEPDYLPDRTVMEKICHELGLQPGEFITYVYEEKEVK